MPRGGSSIPPPCVRRLQQPYCFLEAPLTHHTAPSAARREDAARLQAAAADYEQRLAAARVEWEAEKAVLARQAQREVERVRQEFEMNQVGQNEEELEEA